MSKIVKFNVFLLAAFLAVFILSGCNKKIDIYKDSANFVMCDHNNDFLKFLGFENKEECKSLRESIYKKILDKCSYDFISDKLDEDDQKWFYEKCIEYSLNLESLQNAKSFAEYSIKK